MPNIVEYTNTQNIQPTDRGTEARVQQGRRIGAAYNQVAESLRDFANRTGHQIGSAIQDAGDAAVAYQTHREINQGITTHALLQDSLITQWNDTVKGDPDKGIPPADPNDPTVRQRFIENKLGPALQKWNDAFQTDGGQKWAQTQTRDLMNHMYEKTAADMGTLAAQAVSNSVRTIGNTMSNTAMRDPSSVPHLLNSVDTSIGGLVDTSPNLKGVAAGKAKSEIAEKQKEQIVKAGAMGAIQASSDPEKTAEEWTRKYPQYISGEEARTLAANARQQIRARDYDSRSAAYYKKQADTEASNEATNQYLIDIAQKNVKFNDPTSQKILNDDRLTKADKRNLLNFIDREMKPETSARISAQTSVDLLRKLRQPDVDVRALEQEAWDARLTDAGKPGSLSQPDFDRFRKELADRKTPDGQALAHDRDEFFKKFERTIDVGRKDELSPTALGMQKIYEATSAAKQQEAVLKAKGQDPHSLYDPVSPNYFGKQITRFRPTLAEQTAFDAQLKADKASKEPSATAATFNERFKGGEPVEPSKPAAAEPPRPGARQASDGKWYIEKDGHFYRVDRK